MQKSSLVREKNETDDPKSQQASLDWGEEWVDFVLYNSKDHRGYKQSLFYPSGILAVWTTKPAF